MATVNFSVPDDIKEAFIKEFKGQNKSAIIAELMRRAVEEAQTQQRRKLAFDEIRRIARTIEPMTDEEIWEARQEGRP
jgi:2-oxo-4-hydroxy-4-carboxy--5-ureidoimidazoline (OHCU) decarboxylase